jgi:hypothetical protein
MKLVFAFGWWPVPVFYLPRLWGTVGGFAPLLCILLLEKYRDTSQVDNRAILEHELEHIEQTLKGLLIVHALLYLLVPRYRLWAEVRAYRRQIACYPAGTPVDFAARALATKYRLKISEEGARSLLSARPM